MKFITGAITIRWFEVFVNLLGTLTATIAPRCRGWPHICLWMFSLLERVFTVGYNIISLHFLGGYAIADSDDVAVKLELGRVEGR